MEVQGKLKQRSRSSVKLGKMLQQIHKGFGYEVMELEMTIDDPSIVIGNSKMEDITKLVQLYMIGVQVLESSKHKKYDFFRKKLQELMKKKIVGEELKLDITEYINDPNSAQKKKLMHLQELNKIQNQQSLTFNNIVNNAQENVESCKGIIEGDIKKQQEKIKERLASRSKTKRSEISGSPEKGKKGTTNVQNEYFVSTPMAGSKSAKTLHKDTGKRTDSRENRFDATR